MQRCLGLLLLICCLASTAAAATKTKARLHLSHDEAAPGETITAAVILEMAPGWHTYWRNPGESGGATEVQWELPDGITAGPLQWPVPERFAFLGETNYVFHDKVVLLAPLTLAPDLKPGPVTLRANVSWIECEQQCVPGDKTVTATLRVGRDNTPAAHDALIADAKKKLPQPAKVLNPRAWWEGPANGNSRSFVIEWDSNAEARNADFYPFETEGFDVPPRVEVVPGKAGTVRIRKSAKKFEGDWPEEISGLLIENAGEGQNARGYEATLKLEGPRRGAVPTILPGSVPANWPRMILYAFLGGLILNVMPCVLPVIALKILGFVQQSQEEPATVRRLGIVYALGVLVSFIVLACVVIALKIGWGGQFQSPVFIIVMATVVTLVALNLFGVFEVTLGGRALGAATNLASKGGTAGAFFNGVLATALATPCTAPFLALAVGFAVTQPAAVILLMFVVMGLGLAAPYVALTWMPHLLKLLPRPGAWMEKFKIAMGFPMLATAVWLLSLTSAHFGDRGPLWVGLFTVTVALAAWIWGQFVQRGARKPLAVAASALLLAAGYGYALEQQLNWRNPPQTVAEAAAPSEAIEWKTWSPEAVEEARAAGHPVLVDFTAKWCLTCKWNKKRAIAVPAVIAKLKETDAVAFIADFTRKEQRIKEELAKFGRAGVPLVLVYSPRLEEPPQVLPEILTARRVLAALDKASK